MKKGDIVQTQSNTYKLIQQIGQGGAGTVWKAEAENKSILAIKFLKANSDSDHKNRFKAEISFIKSEQSAFVPNFIDEGEDREGLFFVMPLYPKIWKDILGEKLSNQQKLDYIIQLGKAIQYLHEKGIIHRDLKPENIAINSNDNIVLLDFGIAHFNNSTLTQRSDRLANFNYSAPEQKVRNEADQVTEKADIYSYGLLINELFTNETPSGSNIKRIEDIAPIYAELDSITDNLLQQNPNARFDIKTALLEIVRIKEIINNELEILKEVLVDPEIQANRKYDMAVTQALEDIYFANRLFREKSIDELERKYESNWHPNIGYSLDESLINLTIQSLILETSKHKFDYEGNITTKNSYQPLNLERSSDKKLFEGMKNIFDKYSQPFSNNLKEHGLKYFISITDYHAREVLEKIDGIVKDANENLKNVPILWLIFKLKTSFKDINLESLIGSEFSLSDYIEIDFSDIDDGFNGNTYNPDLSYDKVGQQWDFYFKDELDYLSKSFKVAYRSYKDGYRIIFPSFEEFKKFEIELNKKLEKYKVTDDIVVYDVQAMMGKVEYLNSIVTLYLDEFTSSSVLRKLFLLGEKDD